MRINESTALSSEKVLLVPYTRSHVPAYHEWMLDEELRAATASEALTIEEEYEMQQSWRQDQDKLTFIICKPILRSVAIRSSETSSAKTMVGDINLFLFELEEDDAASTKKSTVGEIELMIARQEDRRQGYGRAALLLFLQYIDAHLSEILGGTGQNIGLPLEYLRVKINHKNVASIMLFESIGFSKTSAEPNYFGEIELRSTSWRPEDGSFKKLKYVEDDG